MLDRREVMGLFTAIAAAPKTALATESDPALRVLIPNGSQANLAPVVQSFEARYRQSVELIVTDVDNINATLAIEAVTQGDRIDVALPATFGIPDLVEAGTIRPLDELAEIHDSADEDASMIYRTGDYFNGRLWGYQTDGDVYMMFYHKDLMHDPDEQKRFEDLHGQPLGIPSDWAALDQQMAFFHRPEQGLYGGCLFRSPTYAAWEWWARLHAEGIWPFSPTMEPQIEGDAGLNALEAMIRSARHLTGSDLGLFDNWERYKRGDIYASIGWGGTQKSLNAVGSGMRNRTVPARLPCALLEEQQLGMSYFNWGWSYILTRHSARPDLAYKFVRHAVSKEASAAAVAEGNGFFDPFRTEHYDDPRIQSVYGTEFLHQHKLAMRHAVPDLYLARRNAYFEALSYWLDAALSGLETPETALRHIANSWRLTTAREGQAAQEKRWAELRLRYPAVLRAQMQDLPGH